MIKLHNINKTFTQEGRDIKALQDINLHIAKEDIFAIIGFSGAGKSTLVRCINLLEKPDNGAQIIVDGHDLIKLSAKELRAKRQKIAMIFQHFNLFKSRTVLENVLYPLYGSKISKSEARDKAQKLLSLVGLENKLDNYPSQLSGGQKQRVAIARALASDPKILLCDEATSALDPQSTKEILDLLKELNHKLKLTIVLITHELAVVKEICNKAAVMEKGRIIEQADVFELFANPKHATTLRFINSASNLSKAENFIAQYKDLLQLNPGEILVRLNYRDRGISEPLISTISHKFNLHMNILFADVEMIQGHPVGGTVGILSGSSEDIAQSLEYLRNKNVAVEELYHA